jgi:UPF0755 protein
VKGDERRGRRRARSRGQRPDDKREPARSRGRPPLRSGLIAFLVSALLSAFCLLVWARTSGPGSGKSFAYDVAPGASAIAVARDLAAQGALSSPRLFALYWAWSEGEPGPGQHLLRDNLSARELAQRLSRLPGRPSVRLTFPEGFNSLQMAERLMHHEICTAESFRAAANNPKLLRELGIRGPSAEGRLFPATYELLVDSDAESVVRLLALETHKRLGKLETDHAAAFAALERQLGWGEQEILTLASIVEKEAATPDEQPLIASVFFNRLTDPQFRPARTLGSDPTAAYGCLVAAALAPSCKDFRGQVTPAMVRDPANPYNTYRVQGLPPGPIANPGEHALRAVLEPAHSDYLYFFARDGRHIFTRTFAEHRQAIDDP